jgi:hypothetical protein
MSPRTQFAYLATAVVLIYGLLALFNPALAARLAGFELIALRGVSEVRASYGALYVTMATLLFFYLPMRPRGVLLVRGMGILLAGMAFGRAFSMLIDGAMTFGNAGWLLASSAVAVAFISAGFEKLPQKERS